MFPSVSVSGVEILFFLVIFLSPEHDIQIATKHGEEKMADSLALGIDLGGSKIYAVVTDKANHVIADAKSPTDPSVGPEETALAMKETALAALGKLSLSLDDVSCFGAAIPSPVDPVTGDCLHAVNLGWKKASMLKIMKDTFGHDFKLGNDGNLGQLGEHFVGAAKGFHSSVGYFIGTGLGGGIIIENKLLTGNKGLAGELGHAVIKAGGRRCGCGHRGCAEAYCSKKAFVKALKKEIFKCGMHSLLPVEKFNPETTNIKSKYLARAYNEDDPAVCKVVDKGLRMLGIAAASTCAVIAPQCIVLGGGFVEAMGDQVIIPFKAAFNRHLFGISPTDIEIRVSTLGDHAVAVGATILARGNIRK